MSILDEILKSKVDQLIDEASNLYDNGALEDSLKGLEKAWQTLPVPQETYADSYHIAHYFVVIALDKKDYPLATHWASILQNCDLTRIDSGHRELIAGQVAYEAGQMDKAKAFFIIANEKSNGRIFQDQDKKYKKLIREK